MEVMMRRGRLAWRGHKAIGIIIFDTILKKMEFFTRRGRLPGKVTYMYLVPVPVLIKMNNNCALM
jgi:hypothetical protein